MAITEEALAQLDRRFTALLPHLNERQRRLAAATEAGCSAMVECAPWPESPE
jgi:hypothetical protein